MSRENPVSPEVVQLLYFEKRIRRLLHGSGGDVKSGHGNENNVISFTILIRVFAKLIYLIQRQTRTWFLHSLFGLFSRTMRFFTAAYFVRLVQNDSLYIKSVETGVEITSALQDNQKRRYSYHYPGPVILNEVVFWPTGGSPLAGENFT